MLHGMSIDDLLRWAPWRGPKPVQWTLALALGMFAAIAAVALPGPRMGIHPAATCAGLAALVLALSASSDGQGAPRPRRGWFLAMGLLLFLPGLLPDLVPRPWGEVLWMACFAAVWLSAFWQPHAPLLVRAKVTFVVIVSVLAVVANASMSLLLIGIVIGFVLADIVTGWSRG